MDLKELGSLLKEQREKKGYTVDEVMEMTKISRVNINAIEAGDKKKLPHSVYAKGFFKNYAKTLGLDADQIGDSFSRAYGIAPEEEKTDIDRKIEENITKNNATKKSNSSIFIIILLLIVVGGGVYYLNSNSYFSPKKEAKIELEDQKEIPTTPVAPVVEETKEVAPVEPVVETKEIETSPAKEIAEPIAETVVEKEISKPVENTKQLEKTVSLTVKPNESCWIEVIRDGEKKDFVLQENESISFTYDKSLSLKIGNAGGITISENGKQISLKEGVGKVKKLTFPKN